MENRNEFCRDCGIELRPGAIHKPECSVQIIRHFDSGATRDTDENKLKYTGFLSQPVLKRYAEYMHIHRKQNDGSLRAPDNWKKGIPLAVYLDSGFRHTMEFWELMEQLQKATSTNDEDTVIMTASILEDTLCAMLFNTMGCLHEVLKLSRM